jgi:hypothetical protein
MKRSVCLALLMSSVAAAAGPLPQCTLTGVLPQSTLVLPPPAYRPPGPLWYAAPPFPACGPGGCVPPFGGVPAYGPRFGSPGNCPGGTCR